MGHRGALDRGGHRYHRDRGHVHPADDGRVTNTLIATGRGVDAHYHKIHLYDAFGFTESRTVARAASR
ncbi:putative amidohydrolase [Mycobacterium xenopi 4042]|uniref:Putative amidohydrolase n=1 Tax=Mycobacterium xenopi 4042 TaxID=1299334 RepID=X8DKI6_MYCXE|nr:putative amidohydrolase [Mycobacterium xenopi 4042]